MTVETTVARPKMPLAAEMFSGFKISGMLAILAGENSALCVPIAATSTNTNQMLSIWGRPASRIAPMPRAMMTISAILQPMMTYFLLKRSAM